MSGFVALLVTLIALSAIFSATEIAVFSLSDAKIKALADAGDRRALILKGFKREPNKLLTAILVGNNLVNIAASSVSTAVALKLFGAAGMAYAIGAITFVVLFFAEITPKTLAAKYNEPFGLFMARPLKLFSQCIYPVVWFFDLLNRIVMKIFQVDLASRALVTQEELSAMVDMGHRSGSLHKMEREIIQRAMEFEEMDVAQVMVPRPDIVSFNSASAVSEVAPLVLKHMHTRYPLYQGDPDNIIGAVSILKLFETAMQEGGGDVRLGQIIEKTLFVPENRRLIDLLAEFKKAGSNLAIVVDEFGAVQGLMANGDILSAVMGGIWQSPEIKKEGIYKVNDSLWIVGGGAKIQDIEDRFDFDIPEKRGYETFGGYIMERADQVPSPGDLVIVPPYRISILQMEQNRILKTKVERMPKEAEQPA